MRSHLGDYVRRQREKQGLNRGQLAKAAGYRNTAKGIRRILDLETTGVCVEKMWKGICRMLQLAAEDVDRVRELDWQDYQAWLDKPIEMQLVLRWMACAYTTVAEAYACEVARERKRKVCLVVSRRLSIWVNEEGCVYSRSTPSRGRPNQPYMQVKNKQFLFRFG